MLTTRRSIPQFSDEQLLAMLKAGSEEAFTEIYARYWKLLIYTAMKRLKNLPEAEEAVQNIFAGLWVRRETLSVRGSLKYYLAAAVQYQVMKQLAAQHRSNYAGSQPDELADGPSPSPAGAIIEFHDLESQIRGIISALPEKCRLVYQLSRDLDLSNKAIAEKLGISEKTVENQLTKALSRLRAGLRLVMFAAAIILE